MTDKQWLDQLADDLDNAYRYSEDDSLPVVVLSDELARVISAKLRKITKHALAMVCD